VLCMCVLQERDDTVLEIEGRAGSWQTPMRTSGYPNFYRVKASQKVSLSEGLSTKTLKK
jgi:hypothetical protein